MEKLILFLLISLSYSNIFSQVCFSSGEKITLSENSFSSKVLVFDVDNDGYKDVVSLDGNTLYWYKNDGNGVFNVRNEIPFSHYVDFINFSENNTSDNYFDLLIKESGPTSHLYNLLNDGSGNFTEVSSSVISNGANFANKDTDGDGYSEIFTINYYNDDDDWDGYDIWNLTDQGEFQHISYNSADNLLDRIYLFDIDDDGDNDLFLEYAFTFEIVLCVNDGSGNFSLPDTVAEESNSFREISFADIDGDNKTDIIANVDDKIVWYKNNGSYEFGTKNIIYDFGSNGNYCLGGFPVDIDNDGDTDVISNTENNIVYYENTDGNGTFSQEKIICTLSGVRDLNISDIDDDGDRDIFVASNDGTYLYINNPEINILQQPENVSAEEGNNISFSVDVAGIDTTFQWYFNNESLTDGDNISGVNTSTLLINNVSQNDAGNYKCHILNSCTDIYSNEASLTINTSYIEELGETRFTISPNPSSDVIYLNFNRIIDDYDIKIINSYGKKVYDGKNKKSINISNFAEGIYYLIISAGDDTYSNKFIIN